MPRASFAASEFNAAAPGLSKLAQAIAGGGEGSYQQGFGKGAELQSKLAMAISQIGAHDASARLNGAKADAEVEEAGRRRPEVLLSGALQANGIPTEEAGAVDQYFKTGKLGGAYAPDASGYGPVLPEPDWAGKLGDVARAINGTQRALTIGDKNSENIAKAGAIERDGRLSDAVIAGSLPRDRVAGAQASAGGKALYHTDTTGAVLDQFGGALDTSNPLATSTIALRTDQAGNQRAGSEAHRAQAEASRALADQRRQVTANGPAADKPPKGYRYTTDAQGEARLEPIPGGPKDPNAQTGKPLPAAAAKGFLENQSALRQVQKALTMINGDAVGTETGDAAATGMQGYLPDAMLSRMDPEGVSTRAVIADISSLKIHDRSGAAVTAAETPRLKPFIPSITDNPATIKKKLAQFESNYRAIMDDAANFYRESGYNVPTPRIDQERGAPPKPGAAPARGGRPAATGFTYLGKE